MLAFGLELVFLREVIQRILTQFEKLCVSFIRLSVLNKRIAVSLLPVGLTELKSFLQSFMYFLVHI